MAKAGWWFAAGVLPIVIWPALDWSQPVAHALTDYWYSRTYVMPSWGETATLAAVFAIVFAVASGLVLFFSLHGIKRAGAADGVGWLSAAASVLVAIWAVMAYRAGGSSGFVGMAAAPGIAMAAAAVLTQVWRKPTASTAKAPARD
ncbi:MAG: hypothetical protein HGB10_09490 [Coriobacteriia bacterium]|nr:hypothetical protein [Coriobacteriia bacterium]